MRTLSLPRVILLFFSLLSLPLLAQQSGHFTYSSSGSAITITGYTGPGGAVTVPASIAGLPVAQIGYRSFGKEAGESTITSVTLPIGVRSIASQAFVRCKNLTSITLPNGLTSIELQAFFECEKLTSITFPNSLVSIDQGAFVRCKNLTSITLPNGLSSIGSQAFFQCESLINITIPGSLTSLGSNTFYECRKLETVTFANGLTTIPIGAFAGCTSLTKVVLPDSLNTIGNQAFNYCTSLTSIVLPSGLTTIGSEVFLDCTSLTSATFMGNAPTFFGSNMFSRVAPDFKIFYHKNTTGFATPLWQGYPAYPIEFTYTIASGAVTITGYTGAGGAVEVPDTIAGLPVTHINSEAFHAGISPNNINITGITFPDSVTYIGWGAFAGCSGLTSVGLGSGVTTIDHNAFYACGGLTAITIPSSVTSIQTSAFLMTGLAEATFVGNAPASFGNSVFDTTNGGFTVYYYDGATGFTSPLWKGYPAVKLGGTHGSIEAWRSRHFGTTQNTGNAADDADPDHDGISNLVEYAFNLNPRSGNNRSLVAGTGTRGLPLITVVRENNGALRLRTEYIRRKNGSNLRYIPQFSSTLEASSWVQSTRTENSRSIDADWERVIVDDHVASAPRRFARVRVGPVPR